METHMKHLSGYQIIVLSCILLIPLTLWSQQTQQPAKRNYAVIGMKNAEGVTVGEADIIADRLRIELFSTGKVSMMERDQMQDILKEQGFQQSGACTDEACMVEIGQLLGVERLISGSIGKLGSMFLLNFRSIDVRTGKIVKVVSKDISGSIEDVVQYLPNIASQLVDETAGKKDVKKEKKEEPVTEVIEDKEEEEAEVKNEEPVAEVKEEVKEPEVETYESVNSSKDKNRSGVRINFSFFPGNITPYFMDSSMSDYKENKYFDYLDSVVEAKECDEYCDYKYTIFILRLNVYFVIKAGPFLTIDVGPGLLMVNRSWLLNYNDGVDWKEELVKIAVTAPNVSAGLNFVKRFYPLKINAGFFADVNFNISRYAYDFTNSVPVSQHEKDMAFSVNVSFGPRAGVEILAGSHFGFSADFVYRYSKLKADLNILTYDDSESWLFKLPGVGICAGINFYY